MDAGKTKTGTGSGSRAQAEAAPGSGSRENAGERQGSGSRARAEAGQHGGADMPRLQGSAGQQAQLRPGAGQHQAKDDFPETGEVVICKIIKILDYGVFVELLEYESLQGFVHISQVASSWIKNIRNFVKEHQIKAGRVVRVDRSKHQVDVSFAKVSGGEQKAKLEAWKQLKKPQRLLEMLAKQHSLNPDTLWNEIAEPLMQNYDSLYDAFVEILIRGEGAAKGVPQKWAKPLREMISKNMEMPVKTVRGTLTLKTTLPNGVDVLKGVLLEARKAAKDADVEIFYEGSGRYAVKANSSDFKGAERILREVADAAVSSMQKAGGRANFEKAEVA